MSTWDDELPPEGDTDESEPTPEELSEASELARALERGVVRPPVAEDAIEMAALLRTAHQPSLSVERKQAIWQSVAEGARAVEPLRGRWGSGWFGWLVPALGALALALYFAVLRPSEAPVVAARTPLPAPSLALLQAQARLGRATEADRDVFRRHMGDYRALVLASLEEQ